MAKPSKTPWETLTRFQRDEVIAFIRASAWETQARRPEFATRIEAAADALEVCRDQLDRGVAAK